MARWPRPESIQGFLARLIVAQSKEKGPTEVGRASLDGSLPRGGDHLVLHSGPVVRAGQRLLRAWCCGRLARLQVGIPSPHRAPPFGRIEYQSPKNIQQELLLAQKYPTANFDYTPKYLTKFNIWMNFFFSDANLISLTCNAQLSGDPADDARQDQPGK